MFETIAKIRLRVFRYFVSVPTAAGPANDDVARPRRHIRTNRDVLICRWMSSHGGKSVACYWTVVPANPPPKHSRLADEADVPVARLQLGARVPGCT